MESRLEPFPVTLPEKRGLEEMRRLLGRAGTWNDGKARVTWVWQGEMLKLLTLEASKLIEERA